MSEPKTRDELAAADQQEGHQQALQALREAQSMSASIRALVSTLLNDDDAKSERQYALLDAIDACAARVGAAAEPAADSVLFARA